MNTSIEILDWLYSLGGYYVAKSFVMDPIFYLVFCDI